MPPPSPSQSLPPLSEPPDDIPRHLGFRLHARLWPSALLHHPPHYNISQHRIRSFPPSCYTHHHHLQLTTRDQIHSKLQYKGHPPCPAATLVSLLLCHLHSPEVKFLMIFGVHKNDFRSSLKPTIVEVLVCLENWVKKVSDPMHEVLIRLKRN